MTSDSNNFPFRKCPFISYYSLLRKEDPTAGAPHERHAQFFGLSLPEFPHELLLILLAELYLDGLRNSRHCSKSPAQHPRATIISHCLFSPDHL